MDKDLESRVTSAPDAESVWEPLSSDGIATIRYKAGAIITEAVARSNTAHVIALTSGKRAVLLADIRQMKSISREARVYFGNSSGSFAAIALLAGSPRTQVIANFFIGLSRPKVPTQMFTDEEKALVWLRRHAV